MGAQELLIVLAILLLLFGAKKLPGLAGSLGSSLKEFRKAADEPTEEGSDAAVGDDTGSTTATSDAVDRDAER